MFEDALLDSSPRRTAVLRPAHYLFPILAGAVLFVLGLYLLPASLMLAGGRGLFIAAAMVGGAAALSALMLEYVWVDARQQGWRAWPWVGLTLLLNLPGFLIYLVCSARKSGNWMRAAIPLAYVAECIFVAVLILVPLIHTQALPKQLVTIEVHVPPPPGPPPGQAVRRQVPPTHHVDVDALLAPPRIPQNIVMIDDRREQPDDGGGKGVIGGLPAGSPNGRLDGVIGSMLAGREAPPPPPVAVAQPKVQRIHLASELVAAKGVYQPKPAYPPLAMMARVQGTVVLQAIIGKDGTVQDLKVLSGHALLVRAAVDAVSTWRYQPTLLNSEPVEVQTEVDVIFRLGE